MFNKFIGFQSRRILFLDESSFNLHTSTKYGYSYVNEDATIYQPCSCGKNLSLCLIISQNAIKHFKLIDGAYNCEMFYVFLNECFEKGIFRNNSILIMDNVAFHKGAELKIFMESRNVTVIFLPPYSPDLNPIENVFSSIKMRLGCIRPRPISREQLKENIVMIIKNFDNCLNYYNKF
ncbi:hypothetical protein DMUE_0326 [Dictyocoela muelleri]|nr:hypothetical protein DMUE_0326 [Dictyocoela muelleri]